MIVLSCDVVVGVYVYVLTFCFFFQAEDGIRDLVRSRGLGDVYKRQPTSRPGLSSPARTRNRSIRIRPRPWPFFALGSTTVSYTHLTLPTSDLV